MKNKKAILAGILLISLVMLACSVPIFSAQLRQDDVQSISSSVIQTLAAQNLQNQVQPFVNNAQVIANAVAQTVVALNAQSQAAQAAVPPANPYVYVAPTATPYPCYSATAWDITVPDYTNFNLNQTFNKTWRFKNVGTCTWNTGFRLAFYSGSQLNAPSYVYLPYNVGPGGTVDVTVPMQTPAYAGTFSGYWGIYTDANYFFGKVWVTITAGSTTYPYFAVTSVTYSINPVSQAVNCGIGPNVPLLVQANITTNGAGTVTYYWTSNYFATTATQTLIFGSAGTQTVTLSETIVGATVPYVYSFNLYIDNPNHQLFPAITLPITCI
jgi:hypothetical protein